MSYISATLWYILIHCAAVRHKEAQRGDSGARARQLRGITRFSSSRYHLSIASQRDYNMASNMAWSLASSQNLQFFSKMWGSETGHNGAAKM